MPKSEESVSNSFFKELESGENPPASDGDGPGYLKFTPERASRILAIENRERQRRRRLKNKRQNRWYAKKAAEKAALKVPVHPTLARAEVEVLEEVLSLA